MPGMPGMPGWPRPGGGITEALAGRLTVSATPNLPTKIIPTKIA